MRLKTYIEGDHFEDDIDRIDRRLKVIVWTVMIVAGAYLIWMVV